MTGRTLLHYEILDRIGQGGMGVVYKARDTHLDRLVAIKFLPPDKISDPERRARFVREAKAASALHHPNIVTIHDIASDSGHDFIVMEYVTGKTLDQLIGRKGLKLNDSIRYGIQIADALAQAHAAGIVHRDLKPSNILVDEHGAVRIVDFGLAKLTESAPGEDGPTLALSAKTEEGAIVGTASYMSPEQAEGKLVDARSDVFSFGAVLYEMLSGRRAFTGESRVSTLAAILNRDPPGLGDLVPRELERIVNRCLRKDPARRWHSMADVKVALEELKEESDSGELAPPPKPARRGVLWPALAGAALLAAVAVGVWIWWGRHGSAGPAAVLEAVPLTSYEGQQMMPTFSPDGSQVAFAWCKDDRCGIYIKLIGVEEPYPLSKPGDNAAWPKWSPDGIYIAFMRTMEHSDGRRLQYVIVPRLGGTEHVVAEFPGPATFREYLSEGGIAWTHDSKTLVVVGAEQPGGNSALYAVSLANRIPKRLLKAPETIADIDPAISPDGRRLAFTRIRSIFQSDIYMSPFTETPAAAGAPVRINTGASADASFPTWMPNGRELLFSGGQGFTTELYRVRTEGNAVPQRMALTESNPSWPVVSAGGRLVYARTLLGDADIFRIKATAKDGLWTAPEKFISSTRFEFEPQFSPDGKKIAVTSARSGPTQIWTFDSDGSNPIALTPASPAGQSRPRWAPDGRLIAFYATSGTNLDVYTVDSTGGNLRQVTDQPGSDQLNDWSCDGKYLYVDSDRERSGEPWKIPVSGGLGERTAVTGRETPDCKWLVYVVGWPDHPAVWRKPLGGGEPELLAESLYPALGFQVFTDGIYYVSYKRTAKGYPMLFRNTSDGKVRELATVPRPNWGLTVSPDRRTILFTANGEGTSNLMMVEGFR